MAFHGYIATDEEQPTKGQQFGRALQQTSGNILQQLSERKGIRDEDEAVKRLTGKDISGTRGDIRSQLVKSFTEAESKKSEHGNMDQVNSALNELESMEDGEGLGIWGSINPSANARYNRGKYQSLQSAIMPLFKGMFPRGMTEKEFKFVNENYIPQPGDTAQTKKGKINGLRKLIGGGSPMMQSDQIQQAQQKQPGNRMTLEEIFQ